MTSLMHARFKHDAIGNWFHFDTFSYFSFVNSLFREFLMILSLVVGAMVIGQREKPKISTIVLI